MKTNQSAPKNIDDYIAGFPQSVQTVLKKVRSTIRKAVPGAQESISYNMPTFKLNGRGMIYFAGWKEHYSLYPSNARLIAAFRTELGAYEFNDKGTIRFPLSEAVPEKLIAGIAQFRAKEVLKATKSVPGVKRRRARPSAATASTDTAR
jgi:uncharacterized protein YdhG (YjbR/CyaY superfamily)